MNQQNHTIEPEELMAYLDGELSLKRAADTAVNVKSSLLDCCPFVVESSLELLLIITANGR